MRPPPDIRDLRRYLPGSYAATQQPYRPAGVTLPVTAAQALAQTGLDFSVLFPMDETSGALVNRGSGTVANLTATGSPTYAVASAGSRGIAYTVAGSDKHSVVSAGSGVDLGTGSFLLVAEFWMASPTASLQAICGWLEGTGRPGFGLYLGSGSTGNTVNFLVRDAVPVTGLNIMTAAAPMNTYTGPITAIVVYDRSVPQLRGMVFNAGVEIATQVTAVGSLATLTGTSQEFGIGRFPTVNGGMSVGWVGIAKGAQAEAVDISTVARSLGVLA